MYPVEIEITLTLRNQLETLIDSEGFMLFDSFLVLNDFHIDGVILHGSPSAKKGTQKVRCNHSGCI